MEIRTIIQRGIEDREGGLAFQTNVNTLVAVNAADRLRAWVWSSQSGSFRAGTSGRTGEATPRSRTP